MNALRAHPDYLDRAVPAEATVGALRLEVLGPEIAEEDYAAVMGSAERLVGLFSDDWPKGLTLEENAIDLAWHLREFEAVRSFAWVIRDTDRRYLGCAYLFPMLGERGAAHAWVWFRRGVMDGPAEKARTAELVEWMRGFSPEGARITLHVPGEGRRPGEG